MHLVIKNGPVLEFEVLDTSGPCSKTQNWLPKVPMGPATPKLALIILKINFWKGKLFTWFDLYVFF